MYDFPRITEFAIPFFVLAMLVELWMIRTHRRPAVRALGQAPERAPRRDKAAGAGS